MQNQSELLKSELPVQQNELKNRLQVEPQVQSVQDEKGLNNLAEPKLFNGDVLDEFYGGASYPGAIEIFVECAYRMLETLDARMMKLTAAMNESKFKEIAYYAHQMKGSFHATGSPLLAQLCDEMGKHSNAQDIETCRRDLENLTTLSEQFVEQLKSFIAKIKKH